MKAYYSCIDGSIPAPQPIQHLVIRDRAAKAGGTVTFYGAEDFAALRSQPFIRPKLARLKASGLDGVIFYTLQQFRYGGELNYRLLLSILDMGLEVIFAVENLTIRHREDFGQFFPFLVSIDCTARRDQSLSWREFVRDIDLETVPVG